MKLLVLAGDGIGPEITGATVQAVEALNHRFNLGLELTHAEAGLESHAKNGTTVPGRACPASPAISTW